MNILLPLFEQGHADARLAYAGIAISRISSTCTDTARITSPVESRHTLEASRDSHTSESHFRDF